jgi:hypothetical protein
MYPNMPGTGVHTFRSGCGQALMIKTNAGKTIIGSPEHPVLTIDTRTEVISFISLEEVTTYHHHLVGIAMNACNLDLDVMIRPVHPDNCDISRFLSLTYEEQIQIIAIRSLLSSAGGFLTIKESSHNYALSLAASASLMGCHTSVSRYINLDDEEQSYTFVHINPLSESSILNQLLMRLCSSFNSPQSYYNPIYASACRGLMTKPQSSMDGYTECLLDLMAPDPSLLYSDQVTRAERIDTSIRLYEICPTIRHNDWADGYIVGGVARYPESNSCVHI